MFGLQLPLTVKPRTTFSNPCNKVRGKYLYKEVFRASFITASVIHCVSMYPVYIYIFLHESADDNATDVCVNCRADVESKSMSSA